MKTILSLSILIGGFGLIGCNNHSSQTSKSMNKSKLKYPETKTIDHVDTYFENKVKDPYRWLEDDQAEDTKAWVVEQNKVTDQYLSTIPFKGKIAKRYKDLVNYPTVSSPRKIGEYTLYSKNSGLQNQSVYYYKKNNGEEKVFIDPNTLSEAGTTTISLMGESKDNKYLAYSRSEAGSDWRKIYIRNIETNTDLEDELDWVKFSGASWHKDGFFYSRYPKPETGDELKSKNKYHSVYYHKVGTSQEEDKLIYRNNEEELLYHWGYVTEDEKYYIMQASSGTDGYEVFYKDLTHENSEFVKLFSGFKNKSSVIDHANGKFYVLTDINAPNYKFVEIDIKHPEQEQWKVLIPEKEHLLESVSTGNAYFWAQYLENVSTHVYRYNKDGKDELEIKLPGIGSAGGFGGKIEDTEFYYGFSSFTTPYTIYKYDIASNTSEVYFQPELKFNPDNFVVKQEFYRSKDGTKIPMFIMHKKGLAMDGQNPTMLYAYGGFNISLKPSFSAANIILLENGGVYAVPNLRGGGEYGEKWHQAGMLMNKQNVFDDYIYAAKYLKQKKYTSTEKLALRGRSNGGLLIGAVMAQQPELAKVAFPQVGVLDMLRYQEFTVGWGWVPEYGSSAESKEMFEYLHGYSPLHNLKTGVEYPATLIATADHDDRVVPAHSFKFAAELQKQHGGQNPVLIRVETNAGHGAGKPISKIIDDKATEWAFMLYNMDETVIY